MDSNNMILRLGTVMLILKIFGRGASNVHFMKAK